MKISFLIFFIAIIFGACTQPVARKPVSSLSGYDQSESIAFNKKLYQGENQMIQGFIERDSLHAYINSQLGFWYTYIQKNYEVSQVPKKGDVVKFRYQISDFQGNIIYSEEEIGEQTYRVEEEEIIQGIQQGVKKMKVGEKILFLFPSHKAYAYHGDEDKIGPNMPITVYLELLSIQ